MGIDIKWVVGGGDLAESVKSSVAQRGLSYDFTKLEEAYTTYNSINREYQHVRSQVNSLQDGITKRYVSSSQPIPEDILHRLKADKAKSKQLALEIKEAFSAVDELRLNLPNIIDPNRINVISLGQPLKCRAQQSKASMSQMSGDYIQRRLPFMSVGRQNLLRTAFEKNRNRWLKENHELPLGLAGEDGALFRISVLYVGTTTAEDLMLRVLQTATLEFFSLFNHTSTLSWEHVAVQDLRKDETRALELRCNGVPSARVSCTTDFHTREYSIRCGPKKRLQQWKQHAYALICEWDLPTVQPQCQAFTFHDIVPLDVHLHLQLQLQERDKGRGLSVPSTVGSTKDLALLDTWLRENSFVRGAMQTSTDSRLRDQVRSSSLPLPAVQYPYIHRWLRAVE